LDFFIAIIESHLKFTVLTQSMSRENNLKNRGDE
jgi:hypothetical protein